MENENIENSFNEIIGLLEEEEFEALSLQFDILTN